MPRVDLTGRAIAITGASSGIGRATALACARAGMDVALAARRTDRLEQVGDEIRALGRRSVSVGADVGEPGQARAFVEAAGDAFGRLDAVFGNAGYGFERATLDCTDDDLRRMFEVNFWGSIETVRAAMPMLERSDSAHALLCSSCLSKIGLPYYAAYCATKAAQDHFGRALRLELRGRGVAVSTVHPIGTKTEFFDQAKARSGGSTLMDKTPSAAMQPPERVANAIVRTLRSGRGREVWTSLPTRLVLGFSVAAPGLTDGVLRRMLNKRSRGA
ncbi:MAG: SDR family oxidoreductase [Planctomycetota bacterium]